MKIALIDPRTGSLPVESFPHLGLGYLAATAKQDGHKVKIFDLRMGNAEQKEGFLQEDFDVVGITATSFTFSEATSIAHSVKEKNSKTKLILGGPHVSIATEEIFLNSPFDFGVIGEGELTFLELLNAFERKKPESFESIPGLIYVENGRTIRTSLRHWIEDLDQLPLPDFTSLNMESYSHYPILTSRGCPFQCVYCNCGIIWGKKWRYRSAEKIVSEIRFAQTDYKWEDRSFVIVDDIFNLKPERVEMFCDLLIQKKLNIDYYVWGFRADRIPLRILEKMKESGTISVSIGIESANPGVLKQIRKGESIEQITQTIRNLKKVGIYPMCLFMIGNPGDTLETVKETIRYVKKNHLYLVTFNMALPYPKTELWNYVENKGTFLHKDYTKFHHYSKEPFFETTDFTAKERKDAFRLSSRLERIQRLKFEVWRKIRFFRRREFRSLSWKQLKAALQRMIKYFLDLVFKREPKEKF
jgi:radical SAM superfamily enzyme YgiQ (UPF0313 family)